MKKNSTLFWIGWTIWICMVVMKAIMVFSGYPDFCWDPMFLILPFSLIIIGGVSTCKECHCREKTVDKD